MACRDCVHLHIVNGRIVYARCLLGNAIFERYGEGRILVEEHSCPAWKKNYGQSGRPVPTRKA